MRINRLIFVLALIFSSNFSMASNFSAEIKYAIDVFLSDFSLEQEAKGYQVEYEIGNIDPHLNLTECDTPPNIAFRQDPFSRVSNTLEIHCMSPNPWKFFVSSKLKIMGDIVVANKTIRRGEALSFDSIATEKSAVNQIQYNSFSAPEEVIGMIAKRTIRQNNIVTSQMLSPPTLVKRGDKVVIVAKNSAISVKMNGVALTDGKLGQQISIRNTRSKRVIQGKVIGAGQTEVTL